jgi:hypothetical protein
MFLQYHTFRGIVPALPQVGLRAPGPWSEHLFTIPLLILP